MNLLHRHIFWNVGSTCVVSVGLFAGVLALANALKDVIGFVLGGQIPVETFVLLMGLLIPYVVAYALPMGVLTGVLLVLGRMSAQNEITAMRAAGLGMGYIARPILLLGVLGALATLVVNFEFMPRARAAYKQILSEAVQRNPLSFIVARTFVRDFPNLVLYVDETNGSQLRDVWFWRLDKEKRVREFGRAKSGEVHFDEDNAAINVVLRDVAVEKRNEKDPENYNKVLATSTIAEVPLTVKVDDIFAKRKTQKYAWMTFTQLMTARDAVAATGDQNELMKVAMAINEKASSALAVFAFAVMAVPLGIKVSRKETSANLGVALGLVMGYYFLTVIATWFEKQPELRPDLLLWVPAAIFTLLGSWMFARVGRV